MDNNYDDKKDLLTIKLDELYTPNSKYYDKRFEEFKNNDQ